MAQYDVAAISRLFEITADVREFGPYGHGLINHTYLVTCEDGSQYILQRINDSIFRDPDALMANFDGVCRFMTEKILADGGDPTRETLRLVPVKTGEQYYHSEEHGWWRMTHFIDGALSHDSADQDGLLYEAAYAFGRFQRRLGDYPAETLHETIKDFHNTPARYAAFEAALAADVAGRAKNVEAEVEAIKRYKHLASAITDKLADGSIPTRVTHNDTKLNNVLIDNETGKGVCVLDLDTVMPGSLLYDFGDSVRFAVNHTREDDPDLSQVWFDMNLYEEYVSGFLRGVGDAITPLEKEMLPMSVFVLTYELVLRFMTDYLNGDVYFKLKYPEHNLDRARAQLRLSEDALAKLDDMAKIGAKY